MRNGKLTALFFSFLFLLILLVGIKLDWWNPTIQLIQKQFGIAQNSKSSSQKNSTLELNLFRLFEQFDVSAETINTNTFLEDKQREISAPIPQGLPDELVINAFSRIVKGTPNTVYDSYYNAKKDIFVITYVSKSKKDKRLVLILSRAKRFLAGSTKIAVLIEDFEFQANQTTVDFLSFPEPLTISLKPFAQKSAWTAKAAQEYNKEVCIQLPFEPRKRIKKSTSPIIMIHYKEKEIAKIITETIKSIPNFKGFGNLYSSVAVEDSRVMGIVLGEIKKHQGYFVNTHTGRTSVVPKTAKKIKVPYSEITAMIKEEKDLFHIENQLKHYTAIARKRGNIIIATRANKSIITVLKKVRPYMKQYGISFVPVSALVQ